MNFSEAQQKAIRHREGPLLVLAGPGSGKTAVITRRVATLTGEYGIAPGNILVITFTKAAAVEMQERYEALCREAGTLPGTVNFGTFHAVFFKILKYAYHYTAENIITEEDSFLLLTEILHTLPTGELEIEDEKEFLAGIRTEISRIKSERLDISGYYSMNCPEELFAALYCRYDEELKKRRRIDFDDMLLQTWELLTKRPDLLAQWQDKYRYILIDEFQDINRLQYEIIRLLARPQDNLFIVGDDDQSIYRFRGAKPEIMLHFRKDYPAAGQILLDHNYRSNAEIVQAALRLISHNKERFTKEIRASRPAGARPEVLTFPTQEEENEYILERIRSHHAQGMPYREMAVLFRTNTQARAIMGKLLSYNVPFRMKDSVPNLFEHWIAGDIIAYLRMAAGERDRALMLRIMNRPKRYLARDLLTEPTVDFGRLRWKCRDKKWVVERIDRLEEDLKLLARANPYAAILYLRRAVGYDKYLEEYAGYRRMRPEELLETLHELSESARGFETAQEWFSYMERYKKELERQKAQRAKQGIEGVTLATMHSAKGLEYGAVFVPEANEGMTPYRRAASEEELEEERRMFYVALTRAKEYLYVCSVRRLYGKEVEVSRFVGEMKVVREELAVGSRVRHATYGLGTIVERQGTRIRIRFDGRNVEKLLEEEVCLRNRLLERA